MKKKLPLFYFVFIILFTNIAAAGDLETIKNRIVNDLMESHVDDAKVSELIKTIREDVTWPGINYENFSPEAFENRYHADNMITLAQAYRTRSSKFYKSKTVKQTVERALKNWVDNDYICETWFNNQIRTPRYLVTLMLLIGDKLVEVTTPFYTVMPLGHVHRYQGLPQNDKRNFHWKLIQPLVHEEVNKVENE